MILISLTKMYSTGHRRGCDWLSVDLQFVCRSTHLHIYLLCCSPHYVKKWNLNDFLILTDAKYDGTQKNIQSSQKKTMTKQAAKQVKNLFTVTKLYITANFHSNKNATFYAARRPRIFTKISLCNKANILGNCDKIISFIQYIKACL